LKTSEAARQTALSSSGGGIHFLSGRTAASDSKKATPVWTSPKARWRHRRTLGSVPNPINRYFLGSDTPMKKNNDGSLTIYIQKDSPGVDKESNCLPAPAGPFF
jgi:hypothetical protein